MAPSQTAGSTESGDTLSLLSNLTSPIKLGTGKEPCRLTLFGEEYDMTNWVTSHPGGDIILQYHQKDASAVFSAFHSKEAFETLKRFRPADQVTQTTGEAAPSNLPTVSPESAAAAADFELLRKELDAEGMLGHGDPVYYTCKVATTVLQPVLAFALLKLFPQSSWMWVVSAMLVGLFYQQVGWLAHEFGHHQVFANRTLNTWMARLLVNTGAGYSLTWWKDRHNKHHGASNILNEDPDIDNLPVFAWDVRDLDRLVALDQQAMSEATIPYQAWYFVPFLTTLHAIWALQSLRFLSVLPQYPNRHIRDTFTADLITLTLHYVWLIYLMFLTPMPLVTGLAFVLISEVVGGFCLAVIVFFSHYVQRHFTGDEPLTFLELQVYSTRNITPSPWMDWFTGGLNYQIEHHLFPTLGRNYLSRVRERVQKLCAKHNLPYAEEGLCEGTLRSITHLDHVAKTIMPQLKAHFANAASKVE